MYYYNKELWIHHFQFMTNIKIKDEKSKFENTLFFVQYISPQKIVLISNQGLEMVELTLNQDGTFEDQDIEELQICINLKQVMLNKII